MKRKLGKNFSKVYKPTGYYNIPSNNKKEKFEQFRKLINKQNLKLKNVAPPKAKERLEWLGSIVGLNNVELDILSFCWYYKAIPDFELIVDEVFDNRRINSKHLSLLGYNQNSIIKALNYKSNLIMNGLIQLDIDGDISLGDLTEKVLSSNVKNQEEVYELILGLPLEAELSLKDYTHMKDKAAYVIKLLKAAVRQKTKGVNIMFYGYPGTGKTEFAKLVANSIGIPIYAAGEDKK
jgi:hypothetical protein